MKPLNRLKDLILEKVPLSEVLQSYHVEFSYDPNKADEVQFKCPIHGTDNKPSARFYRETQTCYCWFCQKRWDVISFIGDKEGLNFVGSIKYIIDKYKLDTTDIPDFDIGPSKPRVVTEDDLEFKKTQENIFIISIRGKIKEYRGKISLERYRTLCGAFYLILFDRFKGNDALLNLRKFESKLEKILLKK